MHWYVFCIWLPSLSITFLRFIQGVPQIRILFFFILVIIPLYGNATFCLSYHKWVNIWIISSSETMNHVDMNICTQAFVWTYVFTSLGQLPTRGLAGSHGTVLFTF